MIKLINEEEVTFLTSYFKEKLLNILYKHVWYNNSKHKIIEFVRLFVASITDNITNSEVENLIFLIFMKKTSEYRKMKIVLLFDLPSVEKEDITENTKFVKNLKKNRFLYVTIFCIC